MIDAAAAADAADAEVFLAVLEIWFVVLLEYFAAVVRREIAVVAEHKSFYDDYRLSGRREIRVDYWQSMAWH